MRKSWSESELDLKSDKVTHNDCVIEFITMQGKEAPKRPRLEGSQSRGLGTGNPGRGWRITLAGSCLCTHPVATDPTPSWLPDAASLNRCLGQSSCSQTWSQVWGFCILAAGLTQGHPHRHSAPMDESAVLLWLQVTETQPGIAKTKMEFVGSSDKV